MKTVHKPILFLIFLFSLSFITPVKTAAQFSMSFQVFYDDLSPYGEWVDNPDYGYVWVPDVSDGFAPYGTNGYWVFTDAGWTWMSYYEWGWAPFHYGRWYHDANYGYAWIPGNEWGPGWVTWRRSEGYYGWAPIGPNISIDIAYGNAYSQPYNQWRFVRDRDFGRTNIYNYYVGSSNNTTIINNSIVINNIHEDRAANVRYNTGPERTEVQRHTGNTINPVSLKQRNRPGQNLAKNELQLYKPKVERSSNDAIKPAPVKVTNWNNGKPEVRRDAALRKQNRNKSTAVNPAEPKRIEEPIRKQPVKTQPVSTEPVKQKPVQQPQRREQPVRTEPVKQKPVQQQPQRTEQPPQRKEQPVRTEPVKQKPVKQKPVQQQPQRTEQPPQRKEQPVRTEPVKQKPVQQQPQRTEQPPQRKEQPVRTEPVRTEPVKQKPVQQPPQRTEQPPQRKEQPPQRKEKPGRTEPGKQKSVQPNGFVGQPSLSPTSKDEPMKQPPAPKKGRGTAGATANDMPLNPEPTRSQHFDVPGRSWPTKPMRSTAPPRHPSGD